MTLSKTSYFKWETNCGPPSLPPPQPLAPSSLSLCLPLSLSLSFTEVFFPTGPDITEMHTGKLTLKLFARLLNVLEIVLDLRAHTHTHTHVPLIKIYIFQIHLLSAH